MDHTLQLSVPSKRRRKHSSQFKAQVIEESSLPGSSIAAVARRHELNANLIHKWMRSAETVPAFIPLSPPPQSVSPAQVEARIEIPSQHGSIAIFWPCHQAESLAQLLRVLA